MRRTGILLVIVAATAFTFAIAPSHGSTPAPTATDPDSLPPAQAYAKLCAPSHGPKAKGYAADHAPSLVNPTFLESATDGYLRASIESGRPATSMGAYAKGSGGPLGPASIDRLVAWLRHGKEARDLPPVAAGDTASGRSIYAANCQSCHGDGQVRGAYVMLANSGFLAVANDRFIQYAIVKGRPKTAMRSFHSKLEPQQIADVVAYVRSLVKPSEITRMEPPTGKEPLFVNPDGQPPSDWKIKEDRYVSVDEAKRALDAHRKFVIIDARPESEWMTAHIDDAVSIPYYKMTRLDEIPTDAWIVAYCACPHHLSGVVVDELRRRHYPHALVLDEGISVWEQRGYPTVAAPGAPLPPHEAPPIGTPAPVPAAVDSAGTQPKLAPPPVSK